MDIKIKLLIKHWQLQNYTPPSPKKNNVEVQVDHF